MFPLWVPVLQTGAFTITLPAVIDNLLSDNNSLPYSLILSILLLLCFSVRVPVRTDVVFVLKCGEGSACFPLPYKIVNVLGINPRFSGFLRNPYRTHFVGLSRRYGG